MARHYFAIPATSVPVEQVFSGAGNVATDKRNRLSSDTMQFILCIKSWLKMTDESVEQLIIETDGVFLEKERERIEI
jgi:hAT family C-terminal dimerisation region